MKRFVIMPFAKDFDDVYLTVQRAVGTVKEGQAQCRRCLAMFAAPGALDSDPNQIGSFTSKRILESAAARPASPAPSL